MNIEQIELLLLITSVVAILARKIRLPYTVGLILVGIMLAFIPNMPELHLTKELIFSLFLPPLIFEAAIQIPWSQLKQNLPVILTLALFGTIISMGIVAAGIHYVVGWDWLVALMVGAILSATDPVSVIATFNESGVKGRLKLLVEAESLFNDGVVVVIFAVLLLLMKEGEITVGKVISDFFLMAFGGLAFGFAVAGLVLWIAGRTEDHLVEITLTTVAAYGSFLLAEHFHTSGVLACVASGLVIGNWGAIGSFTDKGREAVLSFWEYAAFVVNSLIFLLMGVSLPQQILNTENLLLFVGVILLLLVGRAVSVYVCSALFSKSTLKITWSHQHILLWGGLRGALALALVLGLPQTFPNHDAVVSCVFAVVAFSVIIQGLTVTPLLKKLGELVEPSA